MTPSRVVYLQYANPAAYPPLQHSAMIFADAGWKVDLLGITQPRVQGLEFAQHARIAVRLMPPSGSGWRQKIHYLRFCLWTLSQIRRHGPTWVYASDTLSTPVAFCASLLRNVRLVYHEHDAPDERSRSLFMRLLLALRRQVLKRAQIVVVPNAERARTFREARASDDNTFSVWNCPRRSEAGATSQRAPTREMWVVYQGSIVPARVPRTVIEALALTGRCLKLRVIGYETAGHVGYVQQLRDLASSLGVHSAFEYIPTVSRNELLQWTDRSQIGLSLMPLQTDQINERWMRGASNKSFEYLARGVPVLVSDLPEWKATFVDAGFGLACRPDDARSIAEALRWFHDHADEARQMGERGRERILSDWNYEQQFAPVLERMTVPV